MSTYISDVSWFTFLTLMLKERRQLGQKNNLINTEFTSGNLSSLTASKYERMRIKSQNPRRGLNIVISSVQMQVLQQVVGSTQTQTRTHAVRASPLLQVLLLCEQGRGKKKIKVSE